MNVIVDKTLDVETQDYALYRVHIQETDKRKTKLAKAQRYAVVFKKELVNGNDWADEEGHKLVLLHPEVYEAWKSSLLSSMNVINELKKQCNTEREMKEAYKSTLDLLKKNGVID